MAARIVVLGAGFGGLELTTTLSDAMGDALEITLIDKNDSFIFGFSKLDVMFGRQTPAEIRHRYGDIVKPGVRFVQTTVRAIDAEKRRVQADSGTFDADILVVALGADYDVAATPGLAECGHEFYSVAGAESLREVLARFEKGAIVVGVTSTPFKCPPAPSETAFLLHDFLTARGIRSATEISVALPFVRPVPPSPETSAAIVAGFAERGIRFIQDREVRSLDASRKTAVLEDGSEIPFDLFLGVPVHRVPAVVESSGLTVDGWVPVNPKTLETRFPDVYAVGDVALVGTPKAGVFSERQARVVAAQILRKLRGGSEPQLYDGKGLCYIEFGHESVGRVNVDFFSGPDPTGTFDAPSAALFAEKALFGSSRVQRWFGHPAGAKG